LAPPAIYRDREDANRGGHATSTRVERAELHPYALSDTCPALREAPLGLPALRGFRLELAVNRTQFAFRIDRWDRDGHTIMDHVAGSEDLMVAMAAYEAACRHWPGETITLRQGARVIEDSRKERLA